MSLSLPEGIVYDAAGLVPVVAQDHQSGDVLMLAWANAEAVRLTVETGLAHFWSRSRRALWKKGETSGNLLRVRALRVDCDRDTLLLAVEPAGPACHTGSRTCFGDDSHSGAGMLAELERVIESRRGASPDTSYVARLLDKGLDRTLKKIGEEATEVVLAAKGESDARLAEEAADLVFHLLVALRQRGVRWDDVVSVLEARRKP